LRVDTRAAFADVLASVRRTVLDSSAHATLPVEILLRELRRRGIAVPRASVSFAAWASVEEVRFGGVEIEALDRPCGESHPFRLRVHRRYEADRCWCDFDPRLYERAEVERFLGRLQLLIAAICERPETPLRDLQAQLAVEAR
jgi:hypothetical protein